MRPLAFNTIAAVAAAGLALAACDRGQDSGGPVPNIPATVPSTAVPPLAMATPASGVALQGVTPGGRPGDGPSPNGPETSPSPGAGPGNGSTAIGGQAGGQATGGGSNTGGTPAKTSGDGKTP